MQLCIELVSKGLCSYRGAARCLKILGQWFDIPTASHVTIQNWMMRLGGYLLESQRPFQGKWILIPDHTVELGKEKCLVLLGVTTKTVANNIQLEHRDVQVLAILPQEQATGETVLEAFREVTARYGPPSYIVADRGSDLAKAIRLYKEDHPEIVEIYDITHNMACLLKRELHNDPRWEAFSKRVSQTAQETRQTELQFLAPNAMRTKSRFLNLGPILTWAENLLEYGQQADQDEIEAGYFLSEAEVWTLRLYNGLDQLRFLHQLQDRHYLRRDDFLSAFEELAGDLPENLRQVVLVKADKNRERYAQKFAWLEDYREDIALWSQMYLATRLAMTQIKQKGLDHASIDALTSAFSQELKPTTERAATFCKRVLTHVQEQASRVPRGEIWLGTSDIIESIFGKAKIFTKRSPLKTINALLLMIPVCTENLSTDLVKEAMEAFSTKMSREMRKRLFGISAFLKRKRVFSGLKKVQEARRVNSCLI